MPVTLYQAGPNAGWAGVCEVRTSSTNKLTYIHYPSWPSLDGQTGPWELTPHSLQDEFDRGYWVPLQPLVPVDSCL